MQILLLGSGGREHAFAWKLGQSPNCTHLYIAPGNAGTRQFGTNVDLAVNDFANIKKFVLDYGITMVIVGPEEPLVLGIYDYFAADPLCANVAVIGPSAQGAQLEGSKAFAKQFMSRHDIPTAAYREFTATTLAEGIVYLASCATPIVLKADGLAAGKGVVILDTIAAAQHELTEMLGGKFGAASAKVVIEAFLTGIEFSVFAISDGKNYQILPVAKDYKRIGEGDTGLNTGGMGAVSPPPFVDAALMQKVRDRIIAPTIKGLIQENIIYKGFIFFGLINVNSEPFVIEYNCRMGDPETEVVLPRLKNDLLDLCKHLHAGSLDTVTIQKDTRTAAAVMLVAGGYPESYEKGKIITGWAEMQDCLVFQAGTADLDGQIVTNGGRVLAITSLADDYRAAVRNALQNAGRINYEGKYYRTDIGFDL